MPDLDYAKVTGRFSLTAGDTDVDLDKDPDTIWCDSGSVFLTPITTYTKVAGGTPVPFTAGHSVIEATIDSEGYLSYRGARFLNVVDLTSPKVNPQIGEGLATHKVTFRDVFADGIPVAFPATSVRLTAAGANGDGENDLTIVMPVPTGSATPIFRGEQGVGVQTMAVTAGALVVTLDDGSVVNAGALPVGPGGSDAGVAGYLGDGASASRAAARALVATDIRDPSTDVGSAVADTTLLKWEPSTVYAAGDVRLAPDGSTISRDTPGTSPAAFDAPLAAPVLAAPTTVTTGGTLPAGTYFYRATALNVAGETTGSAEVSIVTTGTTSTVGLSWAAIPGATGYKIYRATVAGGQSTSPSLVATLGAVTAYTDTGAVVAAGAVPATDTTTDKAFWTAVGAVPGTMEQLALSNTIGTEVATLVPAASTSTPGRVELATSAETTAGSDTGRAVTPATLKAVTDAQAAVFAQRPTGSGFLAFGDSISTAQDGSAGGAGYGGAWPQMACALSEQRLNFRGNAGVTGNTSTQIRARINDALALSPSVVTILAGANNITAAGSDGAPAFATYKDDIRAICNALRAAGIRVVLCTILPRGGAQHTTTRLATTMKWNAWLREYARNGAEFPADRGGFELVDFFDLAADPATGQFKSGYDSGDGLHPSQTCHLAMAQLIVSKVQTYAYKPIAATINTGDPYNLLANPLLASGGPTPTSWITSGSATADWAEGLVTDADFRGKAWEVAFTSVASASNFRELKAFAVSTGFTPGDTMLFSFRTKITIASGTAIVPSTTAGLRCRVLTAGGTPTVLTPFAGLSVVSGSALHWFRYAVPPGTTSLQPSFLTGVLPVGSNFTSRVGEVGLFNLTSMGLAA